MKYGKKHFTVDENKRDTYRHFDPLSLGDNSPILYHSIGNMKRLVPVYFLRNWKFVMSYVFIMCASFQGPSLASLSSQARVLGRKLKDVA